VGSSTPQPGEETSRPTERKAPWMPPLFRWAGSKRKLLPRLMSLAPTEFKRYIEPFAGSACLFFALRPSCAVLGDTNEELMQTYSTIRSHPRLVARLALTLRNSERQYYRVRRSVLEPRQMIARAARFTYLNRYCFNGVYRTNRHGHFNVPRGTSTGQMPGEAAFYRAAVKLRNTELRATDFQECLADVASGDFVYLDPPYAVGERPTYGEYGYRCFGTCDLERLVATLERLDRMGAKFLLSYADHSVVRALKRRWHCRTLLVRRHVAGFSEDRVRVRELLIANYPVSR
jgi:DNA adenine methylase